MAAMSYVFDRLLCTNRLIRQRSALLSGVSSSQLRPSHCMMRQYVQAAPVPPLYKKHKAA